MICVHELKEKEHQQKRKDRERSPKFCIFWIIWYYLDDILTKFAEKRVPVGKESKASIIGALFVLGDIISTHTFLYFNLGKEGNYFPRVFYDAGLAVHFEVLKILLVSFIIAFNYISATRGWTRSERAGGRMGLFTTYFLFGLVVVWNICMTVISLIL